MKKTVSIRSTPAFPRELRLARIRAQHPFHFLEAVGEPLMQVSHASQLVADVEGLAFARHAVLAEQ